MIVGLVAQTIHEGRECFIVADESGAEYYMEIPIGLAEQEELSKDAAFRVLLQPGAKWVTFESVVRL